MIYDYTSLEQFGKENNLAKYGCEFIFQTDEVREKLKLTFSEKWTT